MGKIEEIAKLKNNQVILRKEVKHIKKKLPSYFVGFILFTVCAIYFLESKLYSYFGNAINFIISGVIISIILILIYLYKSYNSIQQKEKEIQQISGKLYKLMRLETEAINE